MYATECLFKDREAYINSKLALAELFNINPFKALKSTNAKLCAIILKAVPTQYPEDNKYIIPAKAEKYIYDNLPPEVISMFDELNYDEKTARLYDNDIVFGIGGIHSVYADNIETHSDDVWQLVNVDVTSYYPNLIMHFNYMSRSVPDPKLYNAIYEMRKMYKKQAKEELHKNGKTSTYWKYQYLQEGLKLILNTTYGATKNKYNALYDPYVAGSLCYTGQLLLAALASKLHRLISGLKVIQTNTDGILVKVKKIDIPKLEELVHEWENMCGFTMEFDNIVEFFQRDVNNYIECTGNEKDPYKLKGKWANQADTGELIANLNAPIVHKALLLFYTEKIPVEKTIHACDSIYDFCYTTKTGHTYKSTYYCVNGEYIETNKVNRVVATTDKAKGTIYKYAPEKEERQEPNPFSPTYKKELAAFRAYSRKKSNFEEKTKLKFGRLDKVAEIPLHCELLNDELKMIDTLDKDWYVWYCNKKLKELVNV